MTRPAQPSSRSRSLGWIPLLSLLVAACGTPADQRSVAAEPGTAVEVDAPAEVHRLGSDSVPVLLETLATGLAVPWDLDFAPDGRIFITERTGTIRVLRAGAVEPGPWAELEVFADDPAILPESGLMGIALAPDFAETGHVYVMATVYRTGSSRLARLRERVVRSVRSRLSLPLASPYENRIYRLTERDGRGVDPRVIVDDLPSSFYHAGGALRFGPDGMLYASVGDTFESERAQDPGSRVGAILRYTRDGGVPDDNPIPGSPVYAYGLRNSQALAWHPETGDLFATEHGPSFLPHERGRSGHDELNWIVPGGNYGWPVVAGRVDDPRFLLPLADWSPPLAPAGLAFYHSSELPWTHDLLVTGLRGQQLRRLVLSRRDGGWQIAREDTLLAGDLGRIRAIRVGPDGSIYLTTSNRDGRGQPRAVDDRLLRIRSLPTSYTSSF